MAHEKNGSTGQGPVAPYGSPGTFGNFIDSLRSTGLPSRIDRSLPFLSSKSGTIQGQMISALEYLGLITEAGRPTERLKKLVKLDEGDELLAVRQEMLKEAYPFIFDGDFRLNRATTQQIAERFRENANVSGSTVPRAISLFVSLAKKADLEVSPHIKPGSLRKRKKKNAAQDEGGGGGKPKEKPKEEETDEADSGSAADLPPAAGHHTSVVRLSEGGKATIQFPDQLSEADARKLVKMLKSLCGVIQAMAGLEDEE